MKIDQKNSFDWMSIRKWKMICSMKNHFHSEMSDVQDGFDRVGNAGEFLVVPFGV